MFADEGGGYSRTRLWAALRGGFYGTYQIPNFKHQIPNKYQVPISNDQNKVWNFEFWSLLFVCYLRFVIWNLYLSSIPKQPGPGFFTYFAIIRTEQETSWAIRSPTWGENNPFSLVVLPMTMRLKSLARAIISFTGLPFLMIISKSNL